MMHFRSGVVGLDREHDYFIGLASRLGDDTSVTAEGPEQLRALVEHLRLFAHQHFATEEQLMQAYEFPDREAHIAEHQRMKGWVDAFAVQAQVGTLALAMLRGFLQGWLAAHMATQDRALALHLVKVRDSLLSA